MILLSNPARDSLMPILRQCMQEEIPVISIVVETTGLNYWEDHLLQIGATAYNVDPSLNLVESRQFNKYIACSSPIPDRITAINGISNDTVRNAEDEERILRKFSSFCGERFVAIVYSNFAIPWLKYGYIKYGIPFEPIESVDVYRIVQDVYGFSKNSLRMSDICETLKIEILGAKHDAIRDSKLVGKILNKVREPFTRLLPIYPKGTEVPQVLSVEKVKDMVEVELRYYGKVILDPYTGTFSNAYDVFDKVSVNALEEQILKFKNVLSLGNLR